MSTWIHMNCVIKSPIPIDMPLHFGKELPLLDDERPTYDLYKKDKEAWLAETDRIMKHNLQAWDEYDKHPDDYLPVGSEGSLRHSSSGIGSDGRHEYKISGALRGTFDDVKYLEWFRKKFLVWINLTDADKDYTVYGRVDVSNGVGELTWRYGDETLAE